MGAGVSKLERGLLVTAGSLAIVFFLLSLTTASPWRDLFIGMATSFIFFVVFDVILATQRALRHRRRRSFFGTEIFDGELWLTLADFELRDDIAAMLSPAQLRAPYQRPRIPDVPDHPHPITQTTMMCLMDFRAVVEVAGELIPWCSRSPHMTTDTEAIRNRANSFIASGLTDNHCTEMYLQVDPNPLFSIQSQDVWTEVVLSDGTPVHNTDSREFGIILRFHPDRSTVDGRRWFIVAGIDEAGSAAAGYFLAHHWKELARHTDEGDDFVAVVSLPHRAWREPSLTHIVARSATGTSRSVALSS
jgi:hypothetical protein